MLLDTLFYNMSLDHILTSPPALLIFSFLDFLSQSEHVSVSQRNTATDTRADRAFICPPSFYAPVSWCLLPFDGCQVYLVKRSRVYLANFRRVPIKWANTEWNYKHEQTSGGMVNFVRVCVGGITGVEFLCLVGVGDISHVRVKSWAHVR